MQPGPERSLTIRCLCDRCCGRGHRKWAAGHTARDPQENRASLSQQQLSYGLEEGEKSEEDGGEEDEKRQKDPHGDGCRRGRGWARTTGPDARKPSATVSIDFTAVVPGAVLST